MKSIILILLVPTFTFAATTGLMFALHHAVSPVFPITGCGVAILSGLAGILPLARSQKTDPGSLLNLAMAGTVLHLMAAALLSVTAVSIASPELRTRLACWLLGGYWLSLLTVIWQSRLVIVKASALITSLGSNQVKAH